MYLLQTSDKTLLLVIILFIRFFLNTLILHLLSYLIVFGNISYLVTFITLSCISFLFWFFTVFYYISIYIAIKTLWLSVFVKVVFGLSNIYEYISFSIYYLYSCSVILSAFCRFIFLFY